MRFGTRRTRNNSGTGSIDGGEGRGVRLGGSDRGTAPTGWKQRGGGDGFDDDEVLIDTPSSPFDEFEKFSGDDDASPDDRRRDPLRR